MSALATDPGAMPEAQAKQFRQLVAVHAPPAMPGTTTSRLPNWYIRVGSSENGPMRSRASRPTVWRFSLMPGRQVPSGSVKAVVVLIPPRP